MKTKHNWETFKNFDILENPKIVKAHFKTVFASIPQAISEICKKLEKSVETSIQFTLKPQTLGKDFKKIQVFENNFKIISKPH